MQQYEVMKPQKTAFRLHTLRLRVSWQWLKLFRYLWLSPLITASVIALQSTGFLQLLDWATFDQFVRWRPMESPDPRIVIVTIDEPDLKKLGQWPIPDAILAQLITKIKQQNPVAIGLDIYRNLPVEPGNKDLVNVFKNTPNLIGVEKVVEDQNRSSIEPPPILKEKDQVGAADLILDADGKIRRALLSIKPPDSPTILNLGARLALMYLEAQGVTPEMTANHQVKLGKAEFIRFTQNDGGYVRADDKGYQILLNYRGSQDNFKTISITKVLNNQVPPDFFRDKIVLIGSFAQSLNDLFFTPYTSNLFSISDRTPGVIIHANIASKIISSALDGRPLIYVWPDRIEWFWVFIWSTLGSSLGWIYGGTRWTAYCLILATGSLILISYGAFLSGWWLPLISPLLALVSSGMMVTAYIANVERQDRKMVMTLFQRYVNPKIAETIWQNREDLLEKGQIMGQKMIATVLFTDIKGFSTIAEQMEPAMLMNWLNEYMNAMANIVFEHDGVVDKFMGDAVMAVFGVPIPRNSDQEIAQDATSAVSCALAMGEKLRSLNQKWKQQNQPIISMRIGIATGIVVTGSLGSSQRMEYTTLGDSVNIAARLESYDKSFYNQGICRILINEETHKQIDSKFTTCYVGRVQLHGRQQLINIYQVLND
ncbi:adenylate cyclase [Planktothrix agardhii CCAP 1459/11A]|jgi:adenylate cyclase|uniref:Adenylate cyclase n=1 Tax=Planktothrix agardhii CCAP 1459/11A TaxID=282420 RepID=A0A4V0XUL7_PLAAG|nr:adenylate/guanylate cyclase domain-containing protein [Planktothrix agardhii]GDZ94279.1 adenylate cyclase [Planktothrix agardhii CCAP 1459/11A]CAD5949136.1 Adenylate cyclase 1 [Planktothrix rubescens]